MCSGWPGEITAGQTLDLEAELAQPLRREVDLPVFKGIFIAAAPPQRRLRLIAPSNGRILFQ